MASAVRWDSDLLEGFVSTELPLPHAVPAVGEPDSVELIGTLVREDGPSRSRRAVLYVHGWNDYFFQRHLARAFADLGYDFYAVDLRRYGRSLRRGHFAGFITDLDDYDEELDAAADVIAAEHDVLVLMGHSTGGLVASLWAARHPGRVDAVVLNSPWLDLQGSATVRALGTPVIDALGSRSPTAVLRLPDAGLYARALHTSLGGEWDYDLDLKANPTQPIRVGWLRAIRRGINGWRPAWTSPFPCWCLASARSSFARRWSEELRGVDTVLDVEQICGPGRPTGPHVTIVRITDGLQRPDAVRGTGARRGAGRDRPFPAGIPPRRTGRPVGGAGRPGPASPVLVE